MINLLDPKASEFIKNEASSTKNGRSLLSRLLSFGNESIRSLSFGNKTNTAKNFIARQYIKLISPSRLITIAGNLSSKLTTKAAFFVISKFSETYLASNENNPRIDPKSQLISDILKSPVREHNLIYRIYQETEDFIDYYSSLIKAKTVLVTNFNPSRFEDGKEADLNFQLFQKVFKNVPSDGVVILNGDEAISKRVRQEYPFEVLTFGLGAETCSVWAGNIRVENYAVKFELNYGVERVEVNSRILGKHQLYALLGAASLGVSFNIPLIKIKKILEGIDQLDHIMQLCPGYSDSLIIDNTKEEELLSFEYALETLNIVSARRRILILGDLIPGETHEKIKREIARVLYKDKIDLVFLMGQSHKYIADELNKLGFLKEKLRTNLTNPQLVNTLLSILAKGDIVLFNGGLDQRLDEVVKKISKHKKI